MNGLVKVSDHPLLKLVASSLVIEHLELTKCDALTEYSIDMIMRNTPTLKFLDINHIPALTNPILDQLRQVRPDLLMKRFQHQVVDPKDNGLRVPWKIVDKKKKKKKKKGGKKKKK